jgi:hypothetical protein
VEILKRTFGNKMYSEGNFSFKLKEELFYGNPYRAISSQKIRAKNDKLQG